jgi:hypothetical protein
VRPGVPGGFRVAACSPDQKDAALEVDGQRFKRPAAGDPRQTEVRKAKERFLQRQVFPGIAPVVDPVTTLRPGPYSDVRQKSLA